MAPANVLAEDPLPQAVAVQPLREVATASRNGGHSLPPGAGRFAVTIDGTETEEEVASLKKNDAVMALLEIAPGVSRVHASRRIFELLQRHQIDISVIHFRRSAFLHCCVMVAASFLSVAAACDWHQCFLPCVIASSLYLLMHDCARKTCALCLAAAHAFRSTPAADNSC